MSEARVYIKPFVLTSLAYLCFFTNVSAYNLLPLYLQALGEGILQAWGFPAFFSATVLMAAATLALAATVPVPPTTPAVRGPRRQPPSASDFRRHFPRFQGENLQRNRGLVGALEAIAQERGATPAQLAIAWVLSRGTDIVPVIGARTRQQLGEALGACDVVLTREELARIEQAVPAAQVAGTRYGPAQMGMLDSERPAQV